MRPRLEAVEKPRGRAPPGTRGARLQCGHGWRPWRNIAHRIRRAIRSRASMRPRLEAVEKRGHYASLGVSLCASMRPRLEAVEKQGAGRQIRRQQRASMRPRLEAVEKRR